MIARSASRRYTAASSAGASPTRRSSESTGTNPFSSSSSRAAEYFAAQPPQDASSVSRTLPVSNSMRDPPGREKAKHSPFDALYKRSRREVLRYVQKSGGVLAPPPVRGRGEALTAGFFAACVG